MHVGYSLLTLFPDRVGGTETYVRDLLAQFAIGNGPERVTVLANRHVMAAYGPRVGGPVSIHHVRSYRSGDDDVTRALAMARAWALPGLAARDVPRGIDVMHYPVTVPIPRSAVPTVVTIHDAIHHMLPQSLSWSERRYRHAVYDSSLRAARVVIAISHYLRQTLVERARLDPERVTVSHYGVDLERYGPEPGVADEALARFDLPERFLLYPANIWPHKNHRRLLRALAAQRDREVELVLAGQTYGRLPELLAEAATLGLERRVRHVGFIDPDLLPAFYRRALAIVFPSLYENFGSPPLEAMACGCPVASSTRGAMKEVYGDAVLELDPDNVEAMAVAIETICNDGSLRSTLRARGFERASLFTWEAAASRHVEVYARAAAI